MKRNQKVVFWMFLLLSGIFLYGQSDCAFILNESDIEVKSASTYLIPVFTSGELPQEHPRAGCVRGSYVTFAPKLSDDFAESKRM